MDCSRRPHLRKICACSDQPLGKCRFRQVSLNNASAVRASEKVQLSLIGSQQCAFHRAIDEPCSLSLKGDSKREFGVEGVKVTSKLWERWEPEVQACTPHLAAGVLDSFLTSPAGRPPTPPTIPLTRRVPRRLAHLT